MSKLQRERLDEMVRHGDLDLGGEVEEQRTRFAQMMSGSPACRSGDGPGRARRHARRHGDHGSPLERHSLRLHGGAYAIGSAALAAGLVGELAARSETTAGEALGRAGRFVRGVLDAG